MVKKLEIPLANDGISPFETSSCESLSHSQNKAQGRWIGRLERLRRDATGDIAADEAGLLVKGRMVDTPQFVRLWTRTLLAYREWKMPKEGEIKYLELIGSEAVDHALNKPFSDHECPRYLMDLGAIMALLPTPPARILDCGVGTGWTSVFLAKRGYEVVGQDIAQDMITQAEKNKERYGAKTLRFIVDDYENLKFSNEFDAAIFYDSLHHAEDERKAIASIFRALKPGGICLSIEPGETHSQQPQAIEAAKKFGVTERDMPPHLIIAAGKLAGFREFDVFPRPWIGAPVAPPKPPAAPPGLGTRAYRVAKVIFRAFVPAPEPSEPPTDYYKICSLTRMKK